MGETLGGIPLCRLGIAAVAGPVVLIVMVAVKAEGPVMLNPGEEIAQLTPTYPVAHDRATVPVNPPPGVMVTVDVPDFPGAGMIIVVGFADMLKSELLTTAAAEVEPA